MRLCGLMLISRAENDALASGGRQQSRVYVRFHSSFCINSSVHEDEQPLRVKGGDHKPDKKPSRLVDWLRVPTPMRENRVCVWVKVVGSVMKKNIAEFNEKERNFLSPPCRKCDESKAAVRGRKVAGPAVYKNIAECNKIRTAHSEGSCIRGRLTMKRNRGGVGSSP